MPTLTPAAGDLKVINTTGGTLYIGTVDATWANRASDTYVEVGNIENLGDVGYGWNFGEYILQKTGNPVQYKTTRNYGTYTPSVKFNPADTGQARFLTESAKSNDNPINFVIAFDDNPDPSPGDGTPTYIYLRGVPGGLTSMTLGPAGETIGGTLSIGLREFPDFVAASVGTP